MLNIKVDYADCPEPEKKGWKCESFFLWMLWKKFNLVSCGENMSEKKKKFLKQNWIFPVLFSTKIAFWFNHQNETIQFDKFRCLSICLIFDACSEHWLLHHVKCNQKLTSNYCYAFWRFHIWWSQVLNRWRLLARAELYQRVKVDILFIFLLFLFFESE